MRAACPTPASVHTSAYGGSIRADVDGDGIADRIHIVVAPDAPAACAFVLRADTRHGNISGRIWWPIDKYKGETARRLVDSSPVVAGVLHIDRHGAVISVDLGHNASSILLTLFRVRGRRFVQLRIESFSSGLPNIFSYGASVCCGTENADCVGRASGEIVVESFSSPTRNRTRFEVRFYRLTGVAFRRVRIIRGSVRGNRTPSAIPAVRAGFGSC